MIEKICKNCKHFNTSEAESLSWLIKPGLNVGYCELEPFDVATMKSDQMAVICGHDGGVCVGENFGCIHWKEKE